MTTTEFLSLGSTPTEESCAQLGVDINFDEKNLSECRRWKRMLEKRWPEATFEIKAFSHDFGVYREVVVTFRRGRGDGEVEAEEGLAFEIEDSLPEVWDPVGSTKPTRSGSSSASGEEGSL